VSVAAVISSVMIGLVGLASGSSLLRRCDASGAVFRAS